MIAVNAVRCDAVRCDTVRCDTVRCDTVRCDYACDYGIRTLKESIHFLDMVLLKMMTNKYEEFKQTNKNSRIQICSFSFTGKETRMQIIS